MKTLYLILALVPLTAHADETVRVSESCDKRDCFITISGPESPCLETARNREWAAGYVAALWAVWDHVTNTWHSTGYLCHAHATARVKQLNGGNHA